MVINYPTNELQEPHQFSKHFAIHEQNRNLGQENHPCQRVQATHHFQLAPFHSSLIESRRHPRPKELAAQVRHQCPGGY